MKKKKSLITHITSSHHTAGSERDKINNWPHTHTFGLNGSHMLNLISRLTNENTKKTQMKRIYT